MNEDEETNMKRFEEKLVELLDEHGIERYYGLSDDKEQTLISSKDVNHDVALMIISDLMEKSYKRGLYLGAVILNIEEELDYTEEEVLQIIKEVVERYDTDAQ